MRALSFRPPRQPGAPLVLASGSQDSTIRLWNIQSYELPAHSSGIVGTDGLNDELLDAFEATLATLEEGEEGGKQITLKRHVLTVKDEAGRLAYYSPRSFSTILTQATEPKTVFYILRRSSSRA